MKSLRSYGSPVGPEDDKNKRLKMARGEWVRGAGPKMTILKTNVR